MYGAKTVSEKWSRGLPTSSSTIMMMLQNKATSHPNPLVFRTNQRCRTLGLWRWTIGEHDQRCNWHLYEPSIAFAVDRVWIFQGEERCEKIRTWCFKAEKVKNFVLALNSHVCLLIFFSLLTGPAHQFSLQSWIDSTATSGTS